MKKLLRSDTTLGDMLNNMGLGAGYSVCATHGQEGFERFVTLENGTRVELKVRPETVDEALERWSSAFKEQAFAGFENAPAVVKEAIAARVDGMLAPKPAVGGAVNVAVFNKYLSSAEVERARGLFNRCPEPKKLQRKDLAQHIGWLLTTGNFTTQRHCHCHNLQGKVVNLVGVKYRPAEAQAVLATKRVGMKALIVRDPSNGHDSNAALVFAWNCDELWKGLAKPTPKGWVQVGFVRATQANELRNLLPTAVGSAALANFHHIPPGYDGSREGNNVLLRLSDEVRFYSEAAAAFEGNWEAADWANEAALDPND